MKRPWYNCDSRRICVYEPFSELVIETNWFSPEYFGLMMGILGGQHGLDTDPSQELRKLPAYITGAFRWRYAPGGDGFWQGAVDFWQGAVDESTSRLGRAGFHLLLVNSLEGVGAMALQALIAFDQRLWKRMSEQE